MGGIKDNPQATKSFSFDRGHPLPRRTSPRRSVTLRNHAHSRSVSMRGSSGRNSSGESFQTHHSDPKNWFDQSNRNPVSAFESGDLDVDPPFFQKETDSSNEEPLAFDDTPGDLPYPYLGNTRKSPPRPGIALSSSADDYRSVIDDLTVENKKLRQELKRYKQAGPEQLRDDKLFEVKVHGLPERKRTELDAILRNFTTGLDASVAPPFRHQEADVVRKNSDSSGQQASKHDAFPCHSRPVDSAYASMSTAPSSAAPQTSVTPILRSRLSGAKSPPDRKAESHFASTPGGLYPRHLAMAEKDRKKLVVRRLERIFTGRLSARSDRRSSSEPSNTILPEVLPAPGSFEGVPEASREARIQLRRQSQAKGIPAPMSGESRSRGSGSGSRSAGGSGEVSGGGSGHGSGNGARNPDNASPTTPLPEQRATRPSDLDPDRMQVPSENMNYIRHLGLEPSGMQPGQTTSLEDVSPDADGWVYLNLLCNLAQLHMLNVTPKFIRSAVSEMSTKFQLSPDGQKLRWRGGAEGTKFSSDSSGDTSQKSSSGGEDTDEPEGRAQRKKRKVATSGAGLTSTSLGDQSKPASRAATGSADDFYYRPLFARRFSSDEVSLDATENQSLLSCGEETKQGQDSVLDVGASRIAQRTKRRRDGAVIYYRELPFCIDLSGGPHHVPRETRAASTNHQAEKAERMLLSRSSSGSSLSVRPLSDDRETVSEALGLDLESLALDDIESSSDASFDFPWCDEPQTSQLPPQQHCCLETSGLGGVVPEDHFIVAVITRRPISKVAPGRHGKSHDATPNAAESIISRLRSTPPAAASRDPRNATIEIEYLSERTRRLEPVPLPRPSMFFPPFRSDSNTDDEEDDLLDSEEEETLDPEVFSGGLTSQLANPHRSDNTYPDNQNLSSCDEEDEIDEDSGEVPSMDT